MGLLYILLPQKRFRRLRESSEKRLYATSCPSVYPSLHAHRRGFHWTGVFVKLYIRDFHENLSRKIQVLGKTQSFQPDTTYILFRIYRPHVNIGHCPVAPNICGSAVWDLIASWLRARWSVDRIPAGESNFPVLRNVLTGSGAHPASCQGVAFTTHLLLLPKLGMSGALLLLPYIPS